MPLDFPSSPTIGTIYSFEGNSWRWNGYGWEAYSTSTGFPYVESLNGLSGDISISGGSSIGINVLGQVVVLSLNPQGLLEELPTASSASPGIASFDETTFTLSATGHVSARTGISASRIVVIEESPYYGEGATGALPGLDGYKLVNVDAKFLQGKDLGINSGQILVLGESILYGPGATGALPALDGSALIGVNAEYLQGKSPREITDGGIF
jgi:hypothetical protein